MKTPIAIAVAVLAFALIGFAMIPGADADNSAIDTEKGVIEITIGIDDDGKMPSLADVKAFTNDLDSAKLYIPINADAEVGFAQMNDYEKIKPYITSVGEDAFVAIGFGDIGDMTSTEYNEFIESVLKFANADGDGPILDYAPETGVWTGTDTSKLKAVYTIDTPKVAQAEAALAVEAAIAAIEAEIGDVSDDFAEKMVEFEKTLPTKDKDGNEITHTVMEVIEAYATSLEAQIVDLNADLTAIGTFSEDFSSKMAEFKKTLPTKDKDDKEITYTDAQVVEEYVKTLDAKIKELTAPAEEVPFYKTGAGQCAIIVIVFLAILVVWFANKQGYFGTIKAKFKKEAKE